MSKTSKWFRKIIKELPSGCIIIKGKALKKLPIESNPQLVIMFPGCQEEKESEFKSGVLVFYGDNKASCGVYTKKLTKGSPMRQWKKANLTWDVAYEEVRKHLAKIDTTYAFQLFEDTLSKGS